MPLFHGPQLEKQQWRVKASVLLISSPRDCDVAKVSGKGINLLQGQTDLVTLLTPTPPKCDCDQITDPLQTGVLVYESTVDGLMSP